VFDDGRYMAFADIDYAAAARPAQPKHLHQPLHRAAGHWVPCRFNVSHTFRRRKRCGPRDALAQSPPSAFLTQLNCAHLLLPLPIDCVVVGAVGDRHAALGEHPADRLAPQRNPSADSRSAWR
jgi:hypothetical protein